MGFSVFYCGGGPDLVRATTGGGLFQGQDRTTAHFYFVKFKGGKHEKLGKNKIRCK
jgi:hypothetical protein